MLSFEVVLVVLILGLVAIACAACSLLVIKQVTTSLENAHQARAEEISQLVERSMEMIGIQQQTQLAYREMEAEQIQALQNPKKGLYLSEEEEDAMYDGSYEGDTDTGQVLSDLYAAIGAQEG